jgi:hypothetical protein
MGREAPLETWLAVSLHIRSLTLSLTPRCRGVKAELGPIKAIQCGRDASELEASRQEVSHPQVGLALGSRRGTLWPAACGGVELRGQSELRPGRQC